MCLGLKAIKRFYEMIKELVCVQNWYGPTSRYPEIISRGRRTRTVSQLNMSWTVAAAKARRKFVRSPIWPNDTNVFVTDVPMLAPITIGMAWLNKINFWFLNFELLNENSKSCKVLAIAGYVEPPARIGRFTQYNFFALLTLVTIEKLALVYFSSPC